jgi:hypothetical protein
MLLGRPWLWDDKVSHDKDIFAWNYRELKVILLHIAQHWIELNINVPLAH